jgi:hypothetical protein
MIWGKRRFAYADYAPYQDRMQQLVLAHPMLYQQFMMVSTKADGPGESMCYVGVPNETIMKEFDGFMPVPEAALPKVVNVVHFADATTEEFTSRFELKIR